MKKSKKVIALITCLILITALFSGCGGKGKASGSKSEGNGKEAACKVAKMIDTIYVQERNENTDKQCKDAKAAWDALSDEEKEMVKGEFADPDYFGRDTGDASEDDPLNADDIGDKELLVVSFGTSFNESRAKDIGGVEKALQKALPDWSVRRAFTSQIILNHIFARDGEKIDNVEEALDRAVENKVKTLVVQPTHLMKGFEYDDLVKAVEEYKDKFDSVKIAEPLLGDVGKDEKETNKDKSDVILAASKFTSSAMGYESVETMADSGTALAFMGHGTSHVAKVSYEQMQTQVDELGYKNVFIGTVEGEPEGTACEDIIQKAKDAGYKNIILSPLMVVAGDHANNDMAGDDEDSWKTKFGKSGDFDKIDCHIEGLGRIEGIQDIYVAHTKAVMD
jgi:sirohydrochlorin cobaltochelatase